MAYLTRGKDVKIKVTAVVVTYNRIELLKECVGALLGQKFTNPVELSLLIVDNNSTDGTREWTDGLKKASADDQAKEAMDDRVKASMDDLATGNSNHQIEVVHLPENIGGAGGFFEGMKAAYENKADYIWIMDDDTIPDADALDKLIDGVRCQKNQIGFLSSSVLWTDGSPCIMNRQQAVGEAFSWKDTDSTERDCPAIRDAESTESESLGDSEELSPKEITLQQVSSATFVSLLFPREAIEAAGLPIKEYFIWGDDKEYTLRLSSAFPCYHVLDSKVCHKMKYNAGSNIVIDEEDRIPRYFYAFRNDLCTAKRRGAKDLVIYFAAFILNMCRVIFLSKNAKKKRLQIMLKGMGAGMSFSPEIVKIKEQKW